MTQNIDVTGLKQEQIAQIYAIIEVSKKYTRSLSKKAPSSEIPVEKDAEDFDIDISTLVFESEILQPYNRSMLYGQKI